MDVEQVLYLVTVETTVVTEVSAAVTVGHEPQPTGLVYGGHLFKMGLEVVSEYCFLTRDTDEATVLFAFSGPGSVIRVGQGRILVRVVRDVVVYRMVGVGSHV